MQYPKGRIRASTEEQGLGEDLDQRGHKHRQETDTGGHIIPDISHGLGY